MTIANPVVTLRESNERRTMALDATLRRRIYQAVPKRQPTLEQSMAATTTKRFSAMIFFRLYMGIERHPTAGPSKKSNKSPAPVFEGESDPALNVLSTSSKEEPVISESSFVNMSVPAVPVTSGCTILVKSDGKRAPNM
mmetsp:Transcript_20850/g.35822  ORF Transcript_20850/g.35822 Transcript_20850/m.35822 type:complete len:139 (-) Transcript_20850:883-1299(-)